MSTVTSATSSSDAWYSKYMGSGTSSTQSQNSADKTDFLRLMSEQMKNQDPLNPVQGADFLAQLAQFSTVQGIEKVQEAMNAMASVMENDQSLRAATLVGRDVQISADKVTLAAGTEVKGEITATQAGPVQVEVLDEKGNVVQKMALNADASGQVAFQWDGKTENGDTAPAGNYSFRAVGGSGTEGESLSVRLISRIESVSIEPQGLVLNIAGLGSHALSTIRRIS